MTARLAHTLRLCFRPHLWLLYAVSLTAAAIIAASSLNWQPHVTRAFVTGFFEVFGSIAVTLGMGHVLTVDGDEGALEVLLTYPFSRRMLAVERMAAGLMLTAGPLLGLAAAFGAFFYWTAGAADFVSLDLPALLIDAGASWLCLAGVALLASVLAGNWIAGLLAAGLYWVTDITTDGRFTGQLYLFYGTFTPAGVSPGLNRLLLTVCGLAACAAAAWAFGRVRHRG